MHDVTRILQCRTLNSSSSDGHSEAKLKQKLSLHDSSNNFVQSFGTVALSTIEESGLKWWISVTWVWRLQRKKERHWPCCSAVWCFEEFTCQVGHILYSPIHNISIYGREAIWASKWRDKIWACTTCKFPIIWFTRINKPAVNLWMLKIGVLRFILPDNYFPKIFL